jgi:LDH2 family malate/lactate/ureidoglycolate dehydrogenase
MAEGGVGAANRPRVTVERLEDFYRRAFAAVELPAEDAATVARVLLAADVRGIDSHGAPQARGYARMIRSGLANPAPADSDGQRVAGDGRTGWRQWARPGRWRLCDAAGDQ